LAACSPAGAATCRRLADRFNRRHRRGSGVSVGRQYVAQVLRRYRPQIAHRRAVWLKKPASAVPINDTWALDLTQISEPDLAPRTLVLGLIDHGSRQLVSLRVLKRKTSLAVLRVLLDAVERYGIPRCLRTDNEAMFDSALFRFGLRWLGIRPQRSEVRCPWQNGRIERFFGTLKRELGDIAPANWGPLSHRLASFDYYNYARPHMALQGRTPHAVWNDARRASWRRDSG
jgi:transposase InsO family protein